MKRMMRLFRKKSKNEKATEEDEEKHECNAEKSSLGSNSVHRMVKSSAGARTSSVQNAKQRKSSVHSADLPRDPCPSQELGVHPTEKDGDASQQEVRNDCHSLAIVPHNAPGDSSHQNVSLVSSNTWDVSALKDMKRILDPNNLARIAAPQPLNNFMHRLPTVERLQAEGLYTLVDPTIQLISETTEEVGDQLTQMLSPRNKGHDTPNTLPRLTYGGDTGRAAVPQLLYYDSQAAPNHSNQAMAVSHKQEEVVTSAETEAFV